MHLHILGVCGTFMGGIAALARELGHTVTGSDADPYPPMSTQLADQGVTVNRYDPRNLAPAPEQVVIGNALSRGNPEVEAVLDRDLPYTSGPQWLAEALLRRRWVIAVAGTHGKTTTSGMLAWVLEHAGQAPGFLVGGVPVNFGVSARLGEGRHFVVEADEYDTAFFDKRSKFIHYRPRTLILNNLEFDHADIFTDLDAIKQQFHFLVRTVPPSGRLVVNADDTALADVLARGCWSEVTTYATATDADADWRLGDATPDFSAFDVIHQDKHVGRVAWSLIGRHNAANALAAIAAAEHAGVSPDAAITALAGYHNVKRRLEVRGTAAGITVYDDFAHHPTAIATTLEGLRRHIGRQRRIIALLEPRSNTMRMGVHRDTLGPALREADEVFLHLPSSQQWDTGSLQRELEGRLAIHRDIDTLLDAVLERLRPGDQVLIMSNGGFGGIHERMLDRLATTEFRQQERS